MINGAAVAAAAGAAKGMLLGAAAALPIPTIMKLSSAQTESSFFDISLFKMKSLPFDDLGASA